MIINDFSQSKMIFPPLSFMVSAVLRYQREWEICDLIVPSYSVLPHLPPPSVGQNVASSSHRSDCKYLAGKIPVRNRKLSWRSSMMFLSTAFFLLYFWCILGVSYMNHIFTQIVKLAALNMYIPDPLAKSLKKKWK